MALSTTAAAADNALGRRLSIQEQGGAMTKEMFRNRIADLLLAVVMLSLAHLTVKAQSPEAFVPVLPQVKERALPVAYEKG